MRKNLHIDTLFYSKYFFNRHYICNKDCKIVFMKKIIMILAIGLCLFTIQSCGDSDKKDKDKDKKELNAGSVPEPVKSAFNTKYAAASDVKWEDAHEDNKQTYKAKFTMNGKKMKAEYDANGNFVKESEDN